MASRKTKILQYLLAGTTCGVLGGGLGLVFSVATTFADGAFHSSEKLIFLLPVCGVLIVLLYDYVLKDEDLTIDSLFLFVRDGKPVSVWLAPLIFLSTFLACLTGGSVGRVGPALQIGGGTGAILTRKNPEFAKVFVACGIAAGFTAILNTPLAGAFFGVEVFLLLTGSDRMIFIPALISSYITWGLGRLLHVSHVDFHIEFNESISWGILWRVFLTAFVAMLIGRLFCMARRITAKGFCLIKNKILRVLTGSLLVVIITLLIGNTAYNGIGFEYVEATLAGHSAPYAFILKLVLTMLTLGCGIRGGEIAPTIFIGATSCFAFGSLIGLSPELAAAVGIVGALAAVTNCPVAMLVYGFEGICDSTSAMIYFAIAVLIAALFSGEDGLYREGHMLLDPEADQELQEK